MEVQDAIRALKAGKAQGPGSISNRALKHLPLSIVSLLVVHFNAIFRTQYFPVAWKQARVFSILIPGKDPAVPVKCAQSRLIWFKSLVCGYILNYKHTQLFQLNQCSLHLGHCSSHTVLKCYTRLLLLHSTIHTELER
jgi:hypothetical protein